MMQSPTHDERGELRQLVREVLEDWSNGSAGRTNDDADAWRPLWRTFAELGLIGVAVPEALGGMGATVAELAVVAEEVGRRLAPSPLLGTAGLSLPVLAAGGDQDQVKQVLSGEMVLALVTGATARTEGAGWVVTAEATHVVDGPHADALVVIAEAGNATGRVALLVDTTAPGVEVRPEPTLDLTRSLGAVSLVEAPARLITEQADGLAESAETMGRLLLAAEAVGAAQRCLELSVEHARTRLQFGRPIGSFQAVKHRCARMLVEVELARPLVDRAVTETVDGAPHAAVAVDLALERAASAFDRVAKDMIQVHGGIGFTWEHPSHLYLKRATTTSRLLGTSTERRRRLADHVGI